MFTALIRTADLSKPGSTTWPQAKLDADAFRGGAHTRIPGSPVLEATGVVSGMVIVFHDVTLDVDRTRDLQHRAMRDPLTGLSNRTEFEERLRTVFGKAHHLDRPAAVIAIDLDRFKAVNDAAGHAAGDAVLCKVAEACRHAVRLSDSG
jgi:diguanylate cyclase